MIDLFKGELLRFRPWALVAGLVNLAVLAFLSRMVDLAQQPLLVYQVFAMKQAGSPLLDAAEDLLLMGDLFHYMLSGRRTYEYTNASTSQLLDVHART